jgi:hypothetical protein
MTMAQPFPLEPVVRLGDVLTARASWERVDAEAERALGRRCVAIPSVRMGFVWTLEFLGSARHRDHVLVPRFVSRCILGSLGRVALPVEEPTARTRAVIAVDQFGLRHDITTVMAEARRRGWVVLEDSPYGLGDDETPAAGTLVRFIGLAKCLPIVQGGVAVSEDDRLLDALRRRRRERSVWAFPVWAALAALRMRRRVSSPYAAVADAAYELYGPARGGSARARANAVRVLGDLPAFRAAQAPRLRLLREALGERLVWPDLDRVVYVVPYVSADADDGAVADVFRRAGFDPALYHIDLARNLLAPHFVLARLIPTNPRIPVDSFETLVRGLAALSAVRVSARVGGGGAA